MPGAGQASLKIDWGPGRRDTVALQYNPTEIVLEKNVHLAEIAIPGLTAPLQQFVRGEAETLKLELFFDTSDQGMGATAVSVATLTDTIYALSRIVPDQHAPPIVTFVWGSDFPGNELPPALGNQRRTSFKGVVTNIRQTFTLWSSGGVPVRAKISLSLREYASLQDQLKALNLASPNKTHSYVLARGDTLALVASNFYFDPTNWRPIALANGIDDPRRLKPGTELTIPSLPAS
ncbi:LysM peptidoglycan-binding domain-containing protein [Paraburkholderia sp. MM5477-R1]|uniref:CIS tube protein n=1 Tax=Paraburkholderia sp. MM5477-R1 TaxID=2991062 RepID=UPI003D2199CB